MLSLINDPYFIFSFKKVKVYVGDDVIDNDVSIDNAHVAWVHLGVNPIESLQA